MSDEKYPLLETGRDEEALFFSSDLQDKACIGHLRGDFGSGTQFYTTWWDHHEELKDQEFKDELDDVVNTLRKGGPLKDFPAMRRFCREHPQTQMSPRSGSEYHGLRVDTAKHRYYLRFCPMRGNYNFYIYCYKTTLLERTIKALVVEPMKPCYVQEFPGTLEAMQEIVGGEIEAVYPFPEPVAVVCHAEGKMLGLPFNRPLMDENGLPYDILCGTFFIVGAGEEDFVSLTEEQIEKYRSLYDNVLIVPAQKETLQSEKSEHKKKGDRSER